MSPASQIGLPGGKKEESDPTYLQTAIRETHEEIGVNDAEHQLQVCIVVVCCTNAFLKNKSSPSNNFIGSRKYAPICQQPVQIYSCSFCGNNATHKFLHSANK